MEHPRETNFTFYATGPVHKIKKSFCHWHRTTPYTQGIKCHPCNQSSEMGVVVTARWANDRHHKHFTFKLTHDHSEPNCYLMHKCMSSLMHGHTDDSQACHMTALMHVSRVLNSFIEENDIRCGNDCIIFSFYIKGYYSQPQRLWERIAATPVNYFLEQCWVIATTVNCKCLQMKCKCKYVSMCVHEQMQAYLYFWNKCQNL